MADTTEGDNLQLQNLSILVPVLMAFIAGLVIHSFIIGVNVNDWWKGRSLTPVDHIVTSIGISRMCTQCVVTFYVFFRSFILEHLYSEVNIFIIDLLYCFFSYTNIWLTSLLSIVLCLKISNLHTRLFLYLRRMILHRTVYFIAALVALSAFSCLSLVNNNVISDKAHNTTMKGCINIDYMYFEIIGVHFPVLFYYISSILLFTSLYHHTTRMKMSSNLSINLETYYSLMRFLSVTFIYNTMHFFADFTCVFYYYFYCTGLLWLYIIMGFLPLLHSSYLIYRTAKLRDQLSKLLHNVIGFVFQRNNPETQETKEVAPQ